MNDLLAVAVAGTARAGDALGSPAAPIDRAVAQLDAAGAERRVLLAAGAHAIRRRAGVLPLAGAGTIDAADDETWQVAPQRIALLIAELLSGQAADVLPEALDRLQRAQILLPPALLPAALDAGTRSRVVRPGLLAVIGQRGRWLARHNAAWAWATTRTDDELAARTDAIWQEGKQAERLAVLRLVRAGDPARAREMLETTWARERATFRAEAIDILSAGLTAADQPFLEAALDDRAQPVRERAEALLICIPGTAPARDAVERAAPLIGKRLGFQVVVRPPDGTDGTERATLMTEAISRVPPSHWVTQIGKQPADLVQSVARDQDWGFAILNGWTQAALTFSDADWAAALLPAWFTAPPLGMAAKTYAGSYDATIHQHLIALIQIARPADAERTVAEALSSAFNPIRITAVLPQLARPWSAGFSDRYLRSYRDLAEKAIKQSQVNWQASGIWMTSFNTAALAICSGNIQSAIALLNHLSDITPSQGIDYRWLHMKQMLPLFIDALQMRQRIIEEIPG
ncbi:MAG TPA: DUF5691 domain-containing protein [Thermomicrobiales bacterium]|nr:DUF5691 domain-containing protein [Thermomicrobiales bacterium]